MLFFLLGLSKKKGCCTSGNTLSFVYFFLKMAVCEGIEPTPRATKVLLSRQFVEPTNIHTRMALCTGFEPVSPIKSAAFREQCVTSYTNTALAPTFGLEPKHQKLSDYSHLSKMIPYHLGLCRHMVGRERLELPRSEDT